MQHQSFLDHVFATGTFKTDNRSREMAAVLGAMFGPFGLGIYLRSWRVFWITILSITLPMIYFDSLHYLIASASYALWGWFAVDRAKQQLVRSHTTADSPAALDASGRRDAALPERSEDSLFENPPPRSCSRTAVS